MVNVFLEIELRLFVITSTPSFHQPVYDSNLNFGKSKFLITTKPEEDQIIKKVFLFTNRKRISTFINVIWKVIIIIRQEKAFHETLNWVFFCVKVSKIHLVKQNNQCMMLISMVNI